MLARSHLHRPSTALLVAAVATLALVSCGASSSGPEAAADDAAMQGEVTVGAAASLTDAFTEIGRAFERRHPGTTVTFTFASSGTLAQQAIGGAPLDVLATADEQTLDRVADADLLAGDAEPFASNALVLVTRADDLVGLADQPDAALAAALDTGVVALCVETAPCGRLADDVLGAKGIALDEGRITRAADARATLAAVVEGDADAAVVYATDARSAGDRVRSFPLGPEVDGATTSYPIARLADAARPQLADAFEAFVLGQEGRRILAAHGFGSPAR